MSARHRTKWLLLAPALAMLGCSNGTALLAPGTSPPAADSPSNVVNLLVWAYRNRSPATYRTLFASDFRLACAPADSVGYRDSPWTRDDEIEWFGRLFAPAGDVRRFSIDHGTLGVAPDPRPGMASPVHQQVDMSYRLGIATLSGSRLEFTGSARFYVVRGDSAAIPPDLGRAPRPDQWYVERWEDGSSPGTAAIRSSARLAATSTLDSSWCALRHDTLGP